MSDSGIPRGSTCILSINEQGVTGSKNAREPAEVPYNQVRGPSELHEPLHFPHTTNTLDGYGKSCAFRITIGVAQAEADSHRLAKSKLEGGKVENTRHPYRRHHKVFPVWSKMLILG